MAAPSIKAGTGHSLIVNWTSTPGTPSLDTVSPSKGTNANSNIDSHVTGATYNSYLATGSVATTNTAYETDGYIQIGRRIIWKNRPKELEPSRAEAVAVRRIAKRIKGKPKAERTAEAQQIVARAMAMLAGMVETRRAYQAAIGVGVEWTDEDIAAMRAFWKSLEAAAVELLQDEEDDEWLLLS
jgi:hypothetical protein